LSAEIKGKQGKRVGVWEYKFRVGFCYAKIQMVFSASACPFNADGES
jgi:hypothetical protein